MCGTGGEIKSEWLEAHGEGYSDDVEAVENLEVVGCKRVEEDDDVSLGWMVGRRNEPGANGFEIRSLNPVACLWSALGRGAGTCGGRGASGS